MARQKIYLTVEQVIRENLIAIADAYQKATGESDATVSKKFYGRGDFYKKLKAGICRISTRQVDAVKAKFSAKWPPKTAWPMTRAAYMDRPPVD